MGKQRRLVELVGAMVAVCLVSAGLALYVLYNTALEEQRRRLADALDSQVRLIEAVGRFAANEAGRSADSAKQVTLAQVMDAHRRSKGFGQTGEFVLSRREGEQIALTLFQRQEVLAPLPLDSPWGEPMRLAALGETGSCICLDYRGTNVLAVYSPIAFLNMGAVAKIDLAEIRAPFLKAAGMGGVGAVIAITVTAILFVRFAVPLMGSLEESEARNRAIVENAGEGIITIGENGVIESINPAAASIFGYDEAEVIGRPMSFLLPATPCDAENGAQPPRFEQSSILGSGHEMIGRRKAGAPCPIEITVSEVPVGARRFLTAIVRDLSERKRNEAEREDLRRTAEQNARLAEIGALSAKIVHDLGNPLGSLSMQAQRIHRYVSRGDDPKQLSKPVAQLMATIQHVDSLIREFCDFGRGQRLELGMIDVRSFVDDVVSMWEPLAARKGIVLRREVADGVPPLRADAAKLRRVFDNLVKNAIEAIDSPAGEIHIAAAISEPGKIRLSVADTGPGIRDNLRVFRLFETTKENGTGLGLAVSREIVRAHGGGIDFRRVEPRGTVFYVDLPLAGPGAVNAIWR